MWAYLAYDCRSKAKRQSGSGTGVSLKRSVFGDSFTQVGCNMQVSYFLVVSIVIEFVYLK